jgi:hypothetical protein
MRAAESCGVQDFPRGSFNIGNAAIFNADCFDIASDCF